MRKGILLRLISGLVIATPFVFHIATADLSRTANLTALPLTKTNTISSEYPAVTPVSVVSDAASAKNDVLKEAFQAKVSDLLWSGTLDLSKRGEEVENIRLAAETIGMTALQPGETFSFNDIVGIRSEEKGYKPGLMYSNGQVISGIGGGICIVSTFLYNAALESGLKIIERHPHSGPVSYADPGRDAAVSYGWADLRFKNNTDNPIYIQTKVEDDKLEVSLFGTKNPNRSVEVISKDFELMPYKVVEKEDPAIPSGQLKVAQKAAAGFRVTTIRVIKENGKIVSREEISHDTTLPRDKVVLVPIKSINSPMPSLPALPELPGLGTGDFNAPKTGTIQTSDPAAPQASPSLP